MVFGYPRGSVGDIVQLSKVYKGMMPAAADIEGNPDRRHREERAADGLRGGWRAQRPGQSPGAAPAPPTPRPRLVTFQLAMAGALQKAADLYARDKLGRPQESRKTCASWRRMPSRPSPSRSIQRSGYQDPEHPEESQRVVTSRPGRASPARASHQLFHQRHQIVLVEGARVVRAHVEIAPQAALFLQRVEQKLLLDQVFVQQFLVEGAYGTGQRIGDAEFFRGDQPLEWLRRLPGGFCRALQSDQIGAVFPECRFVKGRRVERYPAGGHQPVQRVDEQRADAMPNGRPRSGATARFPACGGTTPRPCRPAHPGSPPGASDGPRGPRTGCLVEPPFTPPLSTLQDTPDVPIKGEQSSIRSKTRSLRD